MISLPPESSFAGSRSSLTRIVDHGETYGPHIIRKYLSQLHGIEKVLDIGAGAGRDLGLVKEKFPQAELNAIECMPQSIDALKKASIKTYLCNIEEDLLPFADEEINLVICNQVLEHVKELFWILHEVTRICKVGGHILIGVPNVASLHNRLGLLFGMHPTQAKACSAHIRVFSRSDLLLFMNEGFPEGYQLVCFGGSQFYPFPRPVARILASSFPTLAFSIFFLFRKEKKYTGSFIDYPRAAHLATNYRTAHRAELEYGKRQ